MMKWKIIPILVASFILVQCRSNKTGVEEVLKALSAEVKDIEKKAPQIASAGDKNQLAKLLADIERIQERIGKETPSDRQVSKGFVSLQERLGKARQDVLTASLESRINELSDRTIQESPAGSSEDKAVVREFLTCTLCSPLTNVDCEQKLIAKRIFPSNKQKELRDKIDNMRELYKSMSEGNFDGTKAVRAYCRL